VELERLFDLSLDILGIVGFDGYFKHVSPAVEQVLGYTREEFLAQPYDLLSAIHTCGSLRAGLAEAFRLLEKQVVSR